MVLLVSRGRRGAGGHPLGHGHARRRGILHRQAGAAGGRAGGKGARPPPGPGGQHPPPRRGRGAHPSLSDPLGTVRTFGLVLLDEDALHLRHPRGRDDAQRLEGIGDRAATLDDQFLGQRDAPPPPPRPPSTVERDAVPCPVSSSRTVSTTTRTRWAGSPSSSQAICCSAVCTPCPISVQEWKRVTVPPASTRKIAFPYSVRPLPTPVFFRPQAIPA